MFLKSLTASVMLLCATLQATEFSNGGFEKKLYKGLPTSWGGKAILKNGEVKPPGSSLDAAEFKEGKQSLKLELSTEDKVIILNTKLGKVVPEKVYEISFWCRISENCRVAIREDHIMSNGKCNSKLFKNFQIINGPTAWKKFSAKVAAKNGDDQLGVSVFIDKGPGSVWLDGFDIQEYEINAGDEVSFRLTPNFYTQNNIFSLPRLAPLMPYLTCANKAQHKFKNPRVILELPEQIQLLSCGYDSTEYKTAEKFNKNGQPYVRYEYTMGVPKSVMRTPDFSKTTFNSVIPLLFTDAVASEKVYKCFIAYKDDTLTCSPSEFGIRITDKIIQTATPKEFSTGIHCGSSVEYNGDPLKKFMMFYKDCGFNNIFLPETLRAGGITEQGMQRDPAPVYDAAREQGLATYLSTNCLINAYMLRYTRATVQAPDSVKIKNALGVIDKNSFDPAYISRKGEWYVQGVNQVVENAIRLNATGIWINWEPWMFIGKKGSFTELSLKDFAKFAQLPEQEVLSTPPMELVRKYQEKLYLFQSWQCDAAMKALMEIIQKRSQELKHQLDVIICTGSIFFKDVNAPDGYPAYRQTFMTEQWMKNFSMVSSWYYLYFTSDDYADPKLKELIDAGFRIPETKVLQPASHAATLENVEEMTEFIHKLCASQGRKATKYIHLSQNIQCGNWVVTPAEIKIQMLAAFLGGADGIDLYYFPSGYDGEYWRNATEANAQIARFEDFVRKGKKLSSKDVSVNSKTQLFKSKEYDFSHRLAVRAFEKDGKVLVAVCNFDFNDSAPADLSLILPVGKFVITAPYEKEYYRDKVNPWVTNAELRSIPVRVSPMSVKFLVIEPWQNGKNYGRAVDLDTIRQENDKLIPVLDKSFIERQEKTDKIQRELKGEQEVFAAASQFKPLIVGGVETSLKKREGKYWLTVKTSSQQVTIAPESGAMVVEWQAEGKTLVSAKGGEQKLGLDRFYLPAGLEGGIDGVYQFENQQVKDGKLNLVFYKNLTKGAFKGLTVYKTFQISDKKTELSVNYRFINKSSLPVTVGFWAANILNFSKWGYKPTIQAGNELLSASDLWVSNYCRNGNDKVAKIEDLLANVKKRAVNTNSVTLKSSAGSVKVDTPANLAGILIWAMEKQEISTLELFFTPKQIKPGAEMQLQLNIASL